MIATWSSIMEYEAIAYTGIFCIFLIALCMKLFSSTTKTKKHPYGLETVVIYKFGPHPTTPAKSPFSIKLETYLRLAKIPYKIIDGGNLSSQGKIPWISHKGADIADSQFCINYLKKEFGVDLNKDMSDSDKAVAQAMRIMVEDNLYWYLWLDRCKYQCNPQWPRDMGFGQLLTRIVKIIAIVAGYFHGIGRHKQENVYAIAIRNVDALSTYLGDKRFFFGDKPVEEDCAIFGQLSIIYYNLYGGVVSNYMKDKLPNLIGYCERMKELAWPDWGENMEERQE